MSKSHAQIYHNLSVMLEAGLPVLKALNTASQGLRGKLAKTLPKIADDISKGTDLTEAMKKYKKIFTPLDLTLIEAGEHSGDLDIVFDTLSDWHHFQLKLKRIILSGMLLPVITITAAAFLAPIPSLVLNGGGITEYIKQAVQILAVFYTPVLLILAIICLTPKQGYPRRVLDEAVLWIPLLRKAVKALALSKYCNCFAMLFSAGVPITDCAEKSADCTGNAIIADWLRGGAKSVRHGKPMYEGFSRHLDPQFLNLWEVGEESGELDKTVQKMAENYKEDAEFLCVELAKWLTRIAYAFVCIIMVVKILQGYGKIYSGTTTF